MTLVLLEIPRKNHFPRQSCCCSLCFCCSSLLLLLPLLPLLLPLLLLLRLQHLLLPFMISRNTGTTCPTSTTSTASTTSTLQVLPMLLVLYTITGTSTSGLASEVRCCEPKIRPTLNRELPEITFCQHCRASCTLSPTPLVRNLHSKTPKISSSRRVHVTHVWPWFAERKSTRARL